LPAKRPLILVCTSGGGIRAATWTAGMLARLSEKSPLFRRLTLLVTGASGGMVGASYWIAAERRRHETGKECDWGELIDVVSQDSLTSVLRALALNDVPWSFRHSPNPSDRGAALQMAWEAGAAERELALLAPLAELREGERRRLWPSLVFSPMVVEDGRR